jgi:hypothetical protein
MAKTKTKERPTTGLPLGPLVKDILKIAYRARRPVLLEGETGIGKSEIVRQVAAELGIGFLVLDLSLLEPPDLVGLPVLADGRTSFALPSILPRDGAGLLLLEELNRAERYIQQPALQLLTARRLHEYVLPDGWLPCAAINPERGDYQVTPLDPALRARFLHLGVRADRLAWLDWAQANGVHPAVLHLARHHEHFFDGVPPRTWTYVSDLLRHLKPAEANNEALLRATLGGYLPHAWIEVLVPQLHEAPAGDGIDEVRLLSAYHQDAELRKLIVGLRESGRTDVLENLAYRVLRKIDGAALNQALGDRQFCLEAFEAFLAELPGDHREVLQQAVADNPAAAALLNVTAKDVLHGSYPTSNVARQVDGWVREPRLHHRAALLVGAVCHAIAHQPDIFALRSNRGALMGLGAFQKQVQAHWAKPLEETLTRWNVQPIAPKS